MRDNTTWKQLVYFMKVKKVLFMTAANFYRWNLYSRYLFAGIEHPFMRSSTVWRQTCLPDSFCQYFNYIWKRLHSTRKNQADRTMNACGNSSTYSSCCIFPLPLAFYIWSVWRRLSSKRVPARNTREDGQIGVTNNYIKTRKTEDLLCLFFLVESYFWVWCVWENASRILAGLFVLMVNMRLTWPPYSSCGGNRTTRDH